MGPGESYYGGAIYQGPYSTEDYYGGPIFYNNPNLTIQGNAYGSQGERRMDQQAEAAARMIITLPADATLTVDGRATRSTSDVRTFVTPPLERGKTFHYDLRAEITRDGKPVTTNKRIEVRAGEDTRVTLNFPEGTSSQK
jgi:uncharacterized protein (TIGR03000 family)